MPPIADAPKWIEPDALFAIDDRYFAIEADMGTESIEAVIKPKISAYREIVATGTIDDHFGIDNLHVLFVTTNEKRMRNMMTAVEVDRAQRAQHDVRLRLPARPRPASRARRLRTGGCSTKPWRRVGHEDRRLDCDNEIAGRSRGGAAWG